MVSHRSRLPALHPTDHTCSAVSVWSCSVSSVFHQPPNDFKIHFYGEDPEGSGGEGGRRGIRMGNTCKSMADSCQCMTKTTTIM